MTDAGQDVNPHDTRFTSKVGSRKCDAEHSKSRGAAAPLRGRRRSTRRISSASESEEASSHGRRHSREDSASDSDERDRRATEKKASKKHEKQKKMTKKNKSPERSSPPRCLEDDSETEREEDEDSEEEAKNNQVEKCERGKGGGGGKARNDKSAQGSRAAGRYRRQVPEEEPREGLGYEEPQPHLSGGAVEWRHSEPKFEPRYLCVKQNLVNLTAAKKETECYFEHRKKIARAKPLVDNKPPPVFTHIICNVKKLREHFIKNFNQISLNFQPKAFIDILNNDEEIRQSRIEKSNHLLLERLVNAMKTTRVDNWNQLYDQRNRNMRTREKARREILNIAAENEKILRRINARRSDYTTLSGNPRQRSSGNERLKRQDNDEKRRQRRHDSARHDEEYDYEEVDDDDKKIEKHTTNKQSGRH